MIILLLGLFSACNRPGQQPVIVDFRSGNEKSGLESDSDTLQPLRVAIATVISPRESFIYYQGYIITHKDSGIERFEDFRNRSFTYSDPLCYTGKLFVDNRLVGLGTRAEHFFFGEIQFSMSHDISIQMVSRALIDGAAVNGLIFEYMKAYHPAYTDNIRIIGKTSFNGIPPVVHAKISEFFAQR